MTQKLLVKIGKSARMRDLCENGTVYMQRLGAYRDLEDKVIGDKNEGLIAHFTTKNPTLKLTVTVGDKSFSMDHNDFQDLKVPCSAQRHGVYCMSAIDVPGDGTFNPVRDLTAFLADRRLLDFGDTLIVFKDSKGFIQRLEQAAKDAGHELDDEGPGPVTYVPDSYCGQVGPYTKVGDYAYQQEFRFMTNKPIPGNSITLKLGSLMRSVLRLDLADYYRKLAA